MKTKWDYTDLALKEAPRIGMPNAWFACMWNHRDLSDPIQKEIENIISSYQSKYDYGDRRQDQTEILKASRLLNKLTFICEKFYVEQSVETTIDAWYSHGTLQRQVGDQFEAVINDIANFLRSLDTTKIKIPYETKIWVAQFVED